jgi:23S rRNA (cytosine1962-C5)-methyltransferase
MSQQISLKPVILKPNREKSVLAKHPWIFSGAVQTLPSFEDGSILAVSSSEGQMLGYGYFNKKSQIIGRMLVFEDKPPLEALKANICKSIDLRNAFCTNTNARRLVNAEGDFCPGLIIDQYDTASVIQISTLGMEKLKSFIVETLQEVLAPTWIFELSTSPSRKEEGLRPVKQTLFGVSSESILVYEGSLKFYVNPMKGQKTGFFADLREMRFLVSAFAKNKRVLNCCSYTGAFSCHALAGQARFCTSLDISEEALSCVARHMELNGFDKSLHEEIKEDVFTFLEKESLDYDLVILDPPAFAKRKADCKKAARGYFEINKNVIKKVPFGSLLVTCSCSYHVSEDLFRTILFQAAKHTGRDVRILHSLRLSFDHPINIYHPEGSYLKAFVLHIT